MSQRQRARHAANEVFMSSPRVSPARSKSSPTSTAGAKHAAPLAAGGPTVGAPAPPFELRSDTGAEVSLQDFRGKWVVLFFYPKDNTPGCTREALAFQAASARLTGHGAVVLGVSRDTVTSHAGFKKKQGLAFPLLSDPAADTHKLYGAFGEKMMYGKKVVGAIRTTVLVRPDGTIAQIFSPVKVDGHADAVLAAIEQASPRSHQG
jgi:peroxiredoxin Q/BCP